MNSPSTQGVGQQHTASQRWARGTGCSELTLHHTVPGGARSTHSNKRLCCFNGQAALYIYICNIYAFNKANEFLIYSRCDVSSARDLHAHTLYLELIYTLPH